jgi:hypothetical protein
MIYSGRVTITSSSIPKFFIFFGSTVVTRIAIFPFILSLSSLSFIIQASCQALVFFDSQTIVPAACPMGFFTVWIRSAHFTPVATSSIVSIGNA